ncbi:MAG: hypothetical protein LUF68_04385 [Clostridiales bacterium]|nr:hypothetical protein [Clostridiales bacterium]
MAGTRFIDLTVDNLFDFCAVLDAVGVEQIVEAFNADDIAALMGDGKTSSEIGLVLTMKICGILVKYIPKAKEELCAFFAGCMVWDNGTAVTADEVKRFKIGAFTQLVREFCRKDDLTDFFREVAEFVGMGQTDSGSSSTTDTAAGLTVI